MMTPNFKIMANSEALIILSLSLAYSMIKVNGVNRELDFITLLATRPGSARVQC